MNQDGFIKSESALKYVTGALEKTASMLSSVTVNSYPCNTLHVMQWDETIVTDGDGIKITVKWVSVDYFMTLIWLWHKWW